jgi:adenosylmethionine-8-amino-7-oxononanoate aminotransferase
VAGSCLGFCPPLIITSEQIDEMIDKVAPALDATLDYCQKEHLLS